MPRVICLKDIFLFPEHLKALICCRKCFWKCCSNSIFYQREQLPGQHYGEEKCKVTTLSDGIHAGNQFTLAVKNLGHQKFAIHTFLNLQHMVVNNVGLFPLLPRTLSSYVPENYRILHFHLWKFTQLNFSLEVTFFIFRP